MLTILEDGNPHQSQDFDHLFSCYTSSSVSEKLHANVWRLRRLLRPNGRDVSTERVDGRTFYRLVRLIGSSYE
jgi:hypothetical protein